MTNKKSMKRALISSLLIMAMCFTMLAGTTYAWFTDSVTSANNIIKSGKLDVEVEYYVPATETAEAHWATLAADTKLFDDAALYEPGYTQVAYIKVKNVGNLALKYKLAATIVSETAGVNMSGEEFLLSDYLVFGSKAIEGDEVYASREAALAAIDPAQKLNALDIDDAGNLLPNKDSGIIALVINMPTTVGNEANYGVTQPKITLGLTVFATQDTVEIDSFDNQYDAAATYPVADAAEFTAALSDPTVGSIVLNNNIAVPGVNTIDGQVLDGNGNTITVSNTGSDCGLNAKSGTIKNVNIVGAGRGIGTGSSGSYAMDGDLYIDGVTVNGPTYGINIGLGNGKKVVVTDSEIYGWNSMANVDASFTNCKFGKGNTNYAVFAIYTYAISFTNCEFGAGYAFYGRASSGGTITLNNCTVGGTTVTAANFATLFDTPHDSDFDYLMNQCEIYVDGVRVNP